MTSTQTTKRVCVITGSRAEYGIMQPMMQKLARHVSLDVIATAMHLEEKYGNTYQLIEADGFHIAHKIPLNLSDTSKATVARSLATLTTALGDIFSNTHYDLIIILGDRYEMLPVANVALIYNIPICHIHGGEKTLGNFDEMIRHAITKMSHLHLVATQEFAKRVKQLGESPNHVFHIGAMGVENVLNQQFLSKDELADCLNIHLDQDYFVVLFHPVTLEAGQALAQTKELLKALSNRPETLIFIGSNSDTDSDKIMQAVQEFIATRQNAKLFTSLATRHYHSLLKHSCGLIGNSSSGLIEAPSLNIPTLNIGNRQLGRLRGASVIDVDATSDAISQGIVDMQTVDDFTNPYEKTGSSDLAVRHILDFLNEKDVLIKDFCDL